MGTQVCQSIAVQVLAAPIGNGARVGRVQQSNQISILIGILVDQAVKKPSCMIGAGICWIGAVGATWEVVIGSCDEVPGDFSSVVVCRLAGRYAGKLGRVITMLEDLEDCCVCVCAFF